MVERFIKPNFLNEKHAALFVWLMKTRSTRKSAIKAVVSFNFARVWAEKWTRSGLFRKQWNGRITEYLCTERGQRAGELLEQLQEVLK